MTARFASARTTGLIGIVFVLMVAVPGFLAGQPPDPDAPASKFLTYYQSNRSALLAGQFIPTGGLMLGIFFIGGLVSALRRAEATPTPLPIVSLVGFVFTGVLATVGGLVSAAAAFRMGGTQHIDAETLRFASDVSSFFFTLIGFPIAAFFVATGLVMRVSSAFPAWLAVLAWVAAILEVVGTFGVFATSGAFAPGGALGLLLGLAPFVVFVLATSIVMIVRSGRLDAAR
jgi:hypothetical protein